MAFTYDLATDSGKVRLLIPDTSATAYVFEDDELDAFLSLESSDPRRAAAMALETMASSEAYVQKAIKVLDLQTNGPAVAKSLMERAEKLRAQAEIADDGDAFDIAEMVHDSFSARERWEKQALRDA